MAGGRPTKLEAKKMIESLKDKGLNVLYDYSESPIGRYLIRGNCIDVRLHKIESVSDFVSYIQKYEPR